MRVSSPGKTATVVLALFVVTMQPAYAHFTGSESVDNGEIRYENRTQWNDSLYWARDRWNGLGSVSIAPDTASTITDVEVGDFNANDNRCGYASTGRVGADYIRLNSTYYAGYSTDQRRACTMHEFGHTLGLDHSYDSQIMASCPVCFNPGITTYLQNHDVADYRALWG